MPMNDVVCRVQRLSGSSVSINLSPDVATVWQVKSLVKRAVDVPRRRQRLFQGTRELLNHSPIKARSGIDGLTLVVVEDRCQWCNDEANKRCVCSGCRITSYCSEACQQHDWKRHKAVCVPPWLGL